MKCSGNFIMGLFARTAELNVDVDLRLCPLNSIVFTAKLQERLTRKNIKIILTSPELTTYCNVTN